MRNGETRPGQGRVFNGLAVSGAVAARRSLPGEPWIDGKIEKREENAALICLCGDEELQAGRTKQNE